MKYIVIELSPTGNSVTVYRTKQTHLNIHNPYPQDPINIFRLTGVGIMTALWIVFKSMMMIRREK